MNIGTFVPSFDLAKTCIIHTECSGSAEVGGIESSSHYSFTVLQEVASSKILYRLQRGEAANLPALSQSCPNQSCL